MTPPKHPACYTAPPTKPTHDECKGCQYFTGADCFRDHPGADILVSAVGEAAFFHGDFPTDCDQHTGTKSKSKGKRKSKGIK